MTSSYAGADTGGSMPSTDDRKDGAPTALPFPSWFPVLSLSTLLSGAPWEADAD